MEMRWIAALSPPIELRGKKRDPTPPLLAFDFDVCLQQSHVSDAAAKVQATSGKGQNRKSEMILWSSNLTRSRSVGFEKAGKCERAEECCHRPGSSRRTRFMKQTRPDRLGFGDNLTTSSQNKMCVLTTQRGKTVSY